MPSISGEALFRLVVEHGDHRIAASGRAEEVPVVSLAFVETLIEEWRNRRDAATL